MGIIKGSVTIATPNPGNYQVNMPAADLDVIGVAPLGINGNNPIYEAPPIVGIYLDASNIGYFPMPINTGYTTRRYTPLHVKLKGTVLNLNVPIIGVGGLTIFYGIPSGDEIEISDLKGVTFSFVNTSTTAPASGTLQVTFPAGNVKIRGIFVLGLYNAWGQISFVTGTGNTLFIPFTTSPDPMDLPNNIYPLDLESATTLPINYNITNNSSGNATLIGIIYYE